MLKHRGGVVVLDVETLAAGQHLGLLPVQVVRVHHLRHRVLQVLVRDLVPLVHGLHREHLLADRVHHVVEVNHVALVDFELPAGDLLVQVLGVYVRVHAPGREQFFKELFQLREGHEVGRVRVVLHPVLGETLEVVLVHGVAPNGVALEVLQDDAHEEVDEREANQQLEDDHEGHDVRVAAAVQGLAARAARVPAHGRAVAHAAGAAVVEVGGHAPHETVPVLARAERDEREQGLAERLEVHVLCEVVVQGHRAEELHGRDRVDEEHQEEQGGHVAQPHQRAEQRLEELVEGLGAAHQPRHAPDAEGADDGGDGADAGAKDPVEQQAQVGGQHDGEIEAVPAFLEVRLAQGEQLDHRLHCEHQREEIVDVLQGHPVGHSLAIVLHAHHHRVRTDANHDGRVELAVALDLVAALAEGGVIRRPIQAHGLQLRDDLLRLHEQLLLLGEHHKVRVHTLLLEVVDDHTHKQVHHQVGPEEDEDPEEPDPVGVVVPHGLVPGRPRVHGGQHHVHPGLGRADLPEGLQREAHVVEPLPDVPLPGPAPALADRPAVGRPRPANDVGKGGGGVLHPAVAAGRGRPAGVAVPRVVQVERRVRAKPRLGLVRPRLPRAILVGEGEQVLEAGRSHAAHLALLGAEEDAVVHVPLAAEERALQVVGGKDGEDQVDDHQHAHDVEHLRHGLEDGVHHLLQARRAGDHAQRPQGPEGAQGLEGAQLHVAEGPAHQRDAHHHEVQHVPVVAQVGPRLAREPEGHDLQHHLHREAHVEDVVQRAEGLLLRPRRVHQGVVQRERDRAHHDEAKHGVVEEPVVDDARGRVPHGVRGAEEEAHLARVQREGRVPGLHLLGLVRVGDHLAHGRLELGARVGPPQARARRLLGGHGLLHVGPLEAGALLGLGRRGVAGEVAQQDGQEQVHHDEHARDDQGEVVAHGPPEAHRPPGVVHDGVPVLPAEHHEDGGHGPGEGVEVGPGSVRGVPPVGHDLDAVAVVVELHAVGEELHADQREDVHEEHHQQREVPHLHGGFDHVGQQHLKILPVLGELEHAEEPQGPERREAAAPRPAGEIGHGQLHQRSHHNEPVKEVENVPRILFESKAHKRDHHFNNKNDSQPKVDVVQNIHNIIIFWVGVH
mmetsp:Transcript_1264/g.2199  ORF Transcript_1264/g.2199 Transcript_1264/m.2199 type:complete len:1121 (-) Transcript_1264:862-4224(-)